MAPIATYVIDYPEALQSAAYLREHHGLEVAGELEGIGGPLSRRKMPSRPIDQDPFIVINGSGNHHHETVPLVDAMLEQTGADEIAYVQLDCHPDKETGYRWLVECNTFVGVILENPRVRSIHLLGLHLPAVKPEDYPAIYASKFIYYRGDYFGKIHQYLASPEGQPETFFDVDDETIAAARANPSTKRVRKKRVAPPDKDEAVPSALVDWRTLDAFDPATLPDLPVYLTVDLDICKNRPVTDWRLAQGKAGANEWGVADNQGIMEWSPVLDLIRSIGNARTIRGADFCGLTEQLRWLNDAARDQSLEAIADVYAALTDAITAGGRGVPAEPAPRPSRKRTRKSR